MGQKIAGVTVYLENKSGARQFLKTLQKLEQDGGLSHSRWRNQCLETNATLKPDDQG